MSPGCLMRNIDMTEGRNKTRAIDTVLNELSQRFGERLKTGMAIREQHGRDESFHKGHPPDCVVAVHSTDEVQQIVRLCALHKIPLIPWGQGTSLEGQIAALRGGVCVDLSEMNAVLCVNADDLDVVVQPGVTRRQLNEYLRDTGKYKHVWGLGRHVLGSQIYDYWMDPWDRVHEHWCDTVRRERDDFSTGTQEVGDVLRWGLEEEVGLVDERDLRTGAARRVG